MLEAPRYSENNWGENNPIRSFGAELIGIKCVSIVVNCVVDIKFNCAGPHLEPSLNLNNLGFILNCAANIFGRTCLRSEI